MPFNNYIFSPLKAELDPAPPQLQSNELDAAPPNSKYTVSKMSMEQVIRFEDEGLAKSMDYSGPLNSIYKLDESESATLGQFLSRPVRLANLSWNEASTFSDVRKIWFEYFNTPSIKNKLENYSRLRCKMHLKFVVNSSQFYYGALRACYHPMQQGQHVVEFNDRVHVSQLPGVWIEPQKMSSVEMTLPFLYTGHFVDITQSIDVKSLGTLEIVEYSPLRSANGVVGGGVTLTLYAWATEVELFAPTAEAALQSDEYEEKQGVISRPATVVAQVAESLSTLPIIGPFARATEIGAKAIASVAGIFGFSNPPVIEDMMPLQPKTFHAMANVETRVPLDKLSLDPKNEITIDNSVCDISSDDPLSFGQTLGRESWMGRVTWDSTYVPNDRLMLVRVNPGAWVTSNAESIRHHSPVGYFSQMFDLWRGSLVYKVKLVKSKYHKGRLLISWDPSGGLTSTSPIETTVFSRVVDLEVDDEFEMVIPYKSSYPWLRIGDATGYDFTKNGSMPYDRRFMNGMFSVRVLNILTGPADLPQIDLHVFVKAGTDFKLSKPKQINTGNWLLSPPNVEGDAELQSSEEVITQGNTVTDSRIDGITVGETISSIRPILHRASLGLVQPLGRSKFGDTTYVGPGHHFTYNVIDRVPRPPGWDTKGYNWAEFDSSAQRFNFVYQHPLRWVISCFLGYRGSVNIYANPVVSEIDTGYIDSLSIERYFASANRSEDRQHTNRGTTTVPFHLDSSLSRQPTTISSGVFVKSTGQQGISVTNTNTQSGLNVNVPQYTYAKFYLSNYLIGDTLAVDGDLGNPVTDNDFTIFDNVIINSSFQTTSVGAADKPWPFLEVYYSAGVDFNPVFFLCTPRVFRYDVPPANDTYAPV